MMPLHNVVRNLSFLLTMFIMLLGAMLLISIIRINLEEEKKDIFILRCLGMSKISIIRTYIEEMYDKCDVI
jgi:ABC-type lipoprotein release transport system permease subunit